MEFEKTAEWWDVKPYSRADGKKPYVTFIFRYRPLGVCHMSWLHCFLALFTTILFIELLQSYRIAPSGIEPGGVITVSDSGDESFDEDEYRAIKVSNRLSPDHTSKRSY